MDHFGHSFNGICLQKAPKWKTAPLNIDIFSKNLIFFKKKKFLDFKNGAIYEKAFLWLFSNRKNKYKHTVPFSYHFQRLNLLSKQFGAVLKATIENISVYISQKIIILLIVKTSRILYHAMSTLKRRLFEIWTLWRHNSNFPILWVSLETFFNFICFEKSLKSKMAPF